MQTITIQNRVIGREEVWEQLEWYCPQCGKQSLWRHVWAVGHKNDYLYYLCIECGVFFHNLDLIPMEVGSIDDKRKQLIEDKCKNLINKE